MITGASHSLHSNLTESLNYYRQQLEQQRITQANNPKNEEVATLPAPGGTNPTQVL